MQLVLYKLPGNLSLMLLLTEHPKFIEYVLIYDQVQQWNWSSVEQYKEHAAKVGGKWPIASIKKVHGTG